jgi:hypothetical protein
MFLVAPPKDEFAMLEYAHELLWIKFSCNYVPFQLNINVNMEIMFGKL